MIAYGKITVLMEGRQLSIAGADRSVFELLVDAGVHDIPAPCGGNGLCGNCKVRVLSGEASAIHPDEERLLTSEQISQGFRLACRMQPVPASDLTIRIVGSEARAQVRTTFSEGKHAADAYRNGNTLSYGCAVDIGTTTIVVYLVSLADHRILGHRSAMNSQRSHGGDVISRIQYCNEHSDGLVRLQRAIVAQLDGMIGALADEHGIDATHLQEIVAVGNPTMIHLLVGSDPGGIAAAPYVPAFTESQQRSAGELGFIHASHAEVVLPGLVSAYVGSDITAGVFASQVLDHHKNILYIDIGTNGEMMLWDGKRLLACSSAAGPAFEGASIRQGLGAIPGAVDRLWIDTEGQVRCSTIAGEPAIGICGSGIIDTVARMMELGLIDETGAMDDESSSYARYGCESPDGLAFRITDAVQFTGRDVREVQLAKAAIAAGADILLDEAGLTADDLGSVMIAGGFGSYIDIASAQRIGLLPPIPIERIVTVGNAAGKGALEVLMLAEGKRTVEHIRKMSEYIELSTSASFQQRFVEHMMFE